MKKVIYLVFAMFIGLSVNAQTQSNSATAASSMEERVSADVAREVAKINKILMKSHENLKLNKNQEVKVSKLMKAKSKEMIEAGNNMVDKKDFSDKAAKIIETYDVKLLKLLNQEQKIAYKNRKGLHLQK